MVRHMRVVGHHHDRAPGAVERLEQRENAETGPAVEGACRLIGQNEHRIADKRAGNRGSLLLAAR